MSRMLYPAGKALTKVSGATAFAIEDAQQFAIPPMRLDVIPCKEEPDVVNERVNAHGSTGNLYGTDPAGPRTDSRASAASWAIYRKPITDAGINAMATRILFMAAYPDARRASAPSLFT